MLFARANRRQLRHPPDAGDPCRYLRMSRQMHIPRFLLDSGALNCYPNVKRTGDAGSASQEDVAYMRSLRVMRLAWRA